MRVKHTARTRALHMQKACRAVNTFTYGQNIIHLYYFMYVYVLRIN